MTEKWGPVHNGADGAGSGRSSSLKRVIQYKPNKTRSFIAWNKD
jgi:hypothetical protein